MRDVMRRLQYPAIGAGVVLAVVAATLPVSRPVSVAAQTDPPSADERPRIVVARPLRRRVTTWATFSGHFSAVQHIELKAQVGGYVKTIHVTDGEIVRQNDLLFTIDSRPYEIALRQAVAQLQIARSGAYLAERQMQRARELRRSEFISSETFDQREQQHANARASVDLAQAAADAAKLNLDFAAVRAPHAGRIGARHVSVGTLAVGGGSGSPATTFATIVSLDPIHFQFDATDAEFAALSRAAKGGSRPLKAEVRIDAEDGSTRAGVIDFFDNEFDRASGNIRVRAVLPNPDLVLVPGQFARLRVPLGEDAEALLVPDAALTTDQTRKVLLTVEADGSVAPRTVEIGGLDGGLRVIRSGISADDRIVIGGLMHAVPGKRAAVTTGTIAAADPKD